MTASNTARSSPVPESHPYSPSPTRSRSSNRQLARSGSVSVFSAKNKLRKAQPEVTSDPTDEDIKSAIASSSSGSPRSTPLSESPPIVNSAGKYQSTSTLDEPHISHVRNGRQSAGAAIVRPNSSMSLLKPNATKEEQVRSLRSAKGAIRLRIIRAFSRLFSFKRSKDRVDHASDVTTPSQPPQRSRLVRLFVPKSSLVKKNKRSNKGKEKDERKDSKSVLDLLDGEDLKAEGSRDGASPVHGLIVARSEAGRSTGKQNGSVDTSSNGIVRLRMKSGDSPSPSGERSKQTSDSMPAGYLLVEDPAWLAGRGALQQREQQSTPPRTPTRNPANSSNPSTPKGKSKDVPNSKSLITAYESGFVMQDISRESERKKNGRHSSAALVDDRKHEKVQFTQAQQAIIPPQPVPSPPVDQIGLAITTDEASLISETIRRVADSTNTSSDRLHPNDALTEDDEEEKRCSWRMPNGFNLSESVHSSPHSVNTVVRATDSPTNINTTPTRALRHTDSPTSNRGIHHRSTDSPTNSTPSRVTSIASSSIVITPTRIVSSPATPTTTRLRRSPHFNSSNSGSDELVEFNVLVRPGDALYDLLVEQEMQQEQLNMEVESEIEYFTADEMESESVSDDSSSVTGEDGVDDDKDVDEDENEDDGDSASDTGTIRAVEIASEGGTMRGVEIVGKNRHGRNMRRRAAGGGGGSWGFSDVLVGARR